MKFSRTQKWCTDLFEWAISKNLIHKILCQKPFLFLFPILQQKKRKTKEKKKKGNGEAARPATWAGPTTYAPQPTSLLLFPPYAHVERHQLNHHATTTDPLLTCSPFPLSYLPRESPNPSPLSSPSSRRHPLPFLPRSPLPLSENLIFPEPEDTALARSWR